MFVSHQSYYFPVSAMNNLPKILVNLSFHIYVADRKTVFIKNKFVNLNNIRTLLLIS